MSETGGATDEGALGALRVDEEKDGVASASNEAAGVGNVDVPRRRAHPAHVGTRK